MTVTIYKSCPSGSATDFLAEITKAISDIPEEYRGTADVEIECDEHTFSARLVITCQRPETEAEAMERKEKRRKQLAEQIGHQERNLAMLKKTLTQLEP